MRNIEDFLKIIGHQVESKHLDVTMVEIRIHVHHFANRALKLNGICLFNLSRSDPQASFVRSSHAHQAQNYVSTKLGLPHSFNEERVEYSRTSEQYHLL
jgi:hypothetical protein